MDEPTATSMATTDAVDTTDVADVAAVEPEVEDVLVEEVSIDGMCGVY